MAVKVLHGPDPAALPLEDPEQINFVLNRIIIEQLSLELPPQVWRIANVVLEISP